MSNGDGRAVVSQHVREMDVLGRLAELIGSNGGDTWVNLKKLLGEAVLVKHGRSGEVVVLLASGVVVVVGEGYVDYVIPQTDCSCDCSCER